MIVTSSPPFRGTSLALLIEGDNTHAYVMANPWKPAAQILYEIAHAPIKIHPNPVCTGVPP